MKGVGITLDDLVRSYVAGFKLRGEKPHVRAPNVSKLTIYKSLQRHSEKFKKCSTYKVGGRYETQRPCACIHHRMDLSS